MGQVGLVERQGDRSWQTGCEFYTSPTPGSNLTLSFRICKVGPLSPPPGAAGMVEEAPLMENEKSVLWTG
jgi:hypothetical protein